jgi:hypothetical protein
MHTAFWSQKVRNKMSFLGSKTVSKGSAMTTERSSGSIE